MAEERSRLFSESWHRVAGYSVQLRPEIEVHKQRFRGEVWHVLQDPYTNRFFRLRQGAWQFVARLRSGATVEEVWQECLRADPDGAPGQDEAIALIGQLYQSNLIASNLPPDSAQLFERKRKREEKEWLGRLKSFLSPKFTLFNPDPFLRVLAAGSGAWLLGAGAVLWLAVVAWGLHTALGHWDELGAQSAGAFEPGNWVPMLLVLAVTKAVHELGHGFVCRCLGGQVPKCGVVLMFFTLPPITLPFMDTTSSYGFRSKRDRILVACGGMLFEFFLAAVACLVWAQIGDGALKRMLHNTMLISTATTVLLNINPLLKFDGYYILTDLLDIPNLQNRANQQLLYLYERRLLRLPQVVNPAHGPGEAWLLAIYGILAFAYRLVLIYALTNLVAGHYFGFGYVLAGVLLVLWVVAPVAKGFGYLAHSPRLFRLRTRAWLVTGGVAAVVLLAALAVPLPGAFKAPGLLVAADRDEVFAEVDGRVVELLAPSGALVQPGDPLVRLANPEIEERIADRQAELRRLALQESLLQTADFSRLPSVRQSAAAARQAVAYWETLAGAQIIRAPRAGIWVAGDGEHLAGRMLVRGARVGEVFSPGAYMFHAVVDQDDASNLFTGRIRRAEVRLKGSAGQPFAVEDIRLIPAAQQKLPSTALGWKAGGEIEVDLRDPEGLQAKREFYLVHARLEPSAHDALRHRRTGYVRFSLPWEPAFFQALRWFRQMLQEKHKV